MENSLISCDVSICPCGPLVSILIPVYNVEAYIERCARSAFEQSYQNLEFIFVDDATPDASIQVLQRVIVDYPDRCDSIKILHHDRNRGLAAARNTAIAACHGDFVMHVDSDDWLEPEAAELLICRQQATRADIVYTRGNYLENGATLKIDCRGWSTDREHLLLNILQDKATMCIWSKLIRRSLYTDHHIRCDEQGSYYEDYQALCQLLYYAKTIARLDAYIYHYDRANPNSIVTQALNNLDIQQQGLRSIQAVYEFFQDKAPRYLDYVNVFLASFRQRYPGIPILSHDYLPDRKA